MTLRARLARIEKACGARDGWIETTLSPTVKLILMEHHLMMHGTEGALDHARQLHARRERRPSVPSPTSRAVEERLAIWSQDARCRREGMTPEQHAELDRQERERQALARRFLDEAATLMERERAL